MGLDQCQLALGRGRRQGGAQGAVQARRRVGVGRQARVPGRFGDPGRMLEDMAVGRDERRAVERGGQGRDHGA